MAKPRGFKYGTPGGGRRPPAPILGSRETRTERRDVQMSQTEEPGARGAPADPNQPAFRKDKPKRRPSGSKPTSFAGKRRLKKAIAKSPLTGRRTTMAELNRASGIKPKTGK